MKTIVIFFSFVFLFFNCSRMGFYAGDKNPQDLVIDYKYDSISPECKEDPAHCKTADDTPFLQARYEDKPGYLTEYFKISSRNELEILLIVDASDSMSDNLQETGKNMKSFLSYIQDKNWRMAFTTADHGDHNDDSNTAERWEDYQEMAPRFGKLMKLEKNGEILNQFILDRHTSEYEQIFKDTLTRGYSECALPPYCHGHNEQSLRALKAAISRYRTDSQNKQFFQPNTDTVVLIITDEDERRNDSKNATTAEEVIQTYDTIFAGQKKRLFGFSISIQDEECYKAESSGFLFSSGADYGRIIGRLAELTGGRNVSLCSKDYGSSLADISQITRSLVESLVLQKIFYIPETVKITLSPPQPQVSWKLYGRKVVFSNGIKPETQVKISYQYER